jgi:hypothetical protein
MEAAVERQCGIKSREEARDPGMGVRESPGDEGTAASNRKTGVHEPLVEDGLFQQSEFGGRLRYSDVYLRQMDLEAKLLEPSEVGDEFAGAGDVLIHVCLQTDPMNGHTAVKEARHELVQPRGFLPESFGPVVVVEEKGIRICLSMYPGPMTCDHTVLRDPQKSEIASFTTSQ